MTIIIKRQSETLPPRCAPISQSIRVCWTDLLVISLILLVVAYFLFGLPLSALLTKRMRRRRKRNYSSRSSGFTISSQHNPSHHGYRMSPRRQDSDETLVDESSNVGYDKLDGVPLDPFLIVQPSLNDSVLVKQGLVEEMTLPPPTHRAYDVQGPPSQVGRSENAFEPSPQTRLWSGTQTVPLAQKLQDGTTSRDTPLMLSTTRESKMTKVGECCEMEPSGDVVPLPPPAYRPYSLGQRRHSYEAV
ncbi:hypothetical protein BC826DRAFT_1001082 [Russula brevipes]|nr:hypothetical protein BC826DRAFT_1001082 [Russula brevipes]